MSTTKTISNVSSTSSKTITIITPAIIKQCGLSEEEYNKIIQLLEREPNLTELGIFGIMWSEHCSYKNTRHLLKLLPKEKKNTEALGQVLVKAGDENAGCIDIGNGWAVCFKIESHNHPSAIEPFEGAATGVGGIIRDIFTMGAEPVLLTNSLRFGELESSNTKQLFSQVVKGISHYGNCVGIPNVGGDSYFESCYEGNPLVNALCLGIVKQDKILKGKAEGIGNPIYYIGAPTGSDGLGGASFASKELSENSNEDRPAVQKGDPLMGKRLLETCLEMIKIPDLVVGVQDMGAGGLTCAVCETAARAGTGIEINLDLVPQRQTELTPHQIMLSESQERMLVIVSKGQESKIEELFQKRDVPAAKIGKVIESPELLVKHKSKTVVTLPLKAITEEAPHNEHKASEPKHFEELRQWNPDDLPDLEYKEILETLPKLLSHPTIANKSWIWQQYDYQVKVNTARGPGGDAAVVRLRLEDSRDKWLAITNDGNSRYCYLNPYRGSQITLLECLRNLVCTGATPLAWTDNLNFGNPQKPEIYYSLKEAINGLADVASFFDLPCVGGNVSLYNESPMGNIDPSPVISAVGLIDRSSMITSHYLSKGDEALILLGGYPQELGGSYFLKIAHSLKTGDVPEVDLKLEKALQSFVLEKIKEGKITAAHDVSEGGLLVAVSKMLFAPGKTFGFNFNPIATTNIARFDTRFFGESQGRILIAVDMREVIPIVWEAKTAKVPALFLGSVKSRPKLVLPWAVESKKIEWDTKKLREVWESSIPSIMEAKNKKQ